MMTPDEHSVVQLLGDVWNAIRDVVADGPNRDADLAEARTHVHALQHMVMANSAAREYPERYRVLGGDL